MGFFFSCASTRLRLALGPPLASQELPPPPTRVFGGCVSLAVCLAGPHHLGGGGGFVHMVQFAYAIHVGQGGGLVKNNLSQAMVAG